MTELQSGVADYPDKHAKLQQCVAGAVTHLIGMAMKVASELACQPRVEVV
jgi:hypothetical protein